MRTTTLLAAATAAASSMALSPALAAGNDAAAVMAVVQKFDKGFNTGDANSMKMCTADAIVIDDFAPHVWQGANACARWWKDVGADDTRKGIDNGIVTLGKPWRVSVTGDRAYVVEPVVYTYKQHGKPMTEAGSVWTLAFVKVGGAWRVSGWSWGQHS